MKQSKKEDGNQGAEAGTRIELLAAASYRIEPGGRPSGYVSDSKVFAEYALEMIEHLAEELYEEGSQLAANPRSASTMLWGASQHLRMALAAIAASEISAR